MCGKLPNRRLPIEESVLMVNCLRLPSAKILADHASADRGRLVDRLFSSLQEQTPWLSFLAELERQLDCLMALVLRSPRKGDPGVIIFPQASQIIAQNVRIYQEQFFDQSFFQEAPNEKVFALHELFSPEELEHQPYYQAYLKHHDIHDIIYLNLRDPNSGATLRLRGARKKDQSRFDGAEHQLLQDLIPSLKNAFALYSRIEKLQFELGIYDENISDKLSVGSIMLGEYGEVLLTNRVAARLIKEGNGFSLRTGLLRCTHSASDKALNEAVTSIIHALRIGQTGMEKNVRVKCADQQNYWNVLCRPVMGKMALDGVSTPAVQLLVRSAQQQNEITIPMLQELFGLTKAEAVLAQKLVSGLSLNEAAVELQISPHTARAQLGAIFSKTDSHRQPQLVGLILNTINNTWV